MAEHAGFVADIIANPADDVPRLIFADWLEDHGEPERAGYIRDAVRWPHAAFARLTSMKNPFPVLGLEPGLPQRVGIPGVGEQWRTWMWGETDDLGCVIHDLGRDVDYKVDRGFICAVRCKVEAWRLYGPALASRHPIGGVLLHRSVRRPEALDDSWTVYRGAGEGDLPGEIYTFLRAHTCRNSFHVLAGTHAHFESQHAGEDAVTFAALTWARHAAKAQPVEV